MNIYQTNRLGKGELQRDMQKKSRETAQIETRGFEAFTAAFDRQANGL